MPALTFNDITKTADVSIFKTDDDKRLVFGWASVSIDLNGEQLEDRQKDLIDPEDLEEAAYEYVLNFRDTGEEHIPTMRKKGKLVESCVFTAEKQRAMGIPEGTLPIAWWIGFKIEDDDAWERVKNGTYRMFSIEGKASREPVEKSAPTAQTFDDVLKFNAYHDAKGRFSTTDAATSFTFAPGKSKAHDLAIQRAKERHAAGGGEPDKKVKYKNLNKRSVEDMAKQMGQDNMPQEDIDQMNDHGMGGYFGTGHSFHMNDDLRGGKDVKDFNDDDQKTIETLDRNMSGCPENVRLNRMVGGDMLNSLGIDANRALSGGDDTELQKAVGKVFTNKGYSSTSYDMGENVFSGRRVKMNIDAPKGTKMLVRPGQSEAEILLARGTSMHVKAIRRTKPSAWGPSIEIDCEVLLD